LRGPDERWGRRGGTAKAGGRVDKEKDVAWIEEWRGWIGGYGGWRGGGVRKEREGDARAGRSVEASSRWAGNVWDS